MKKIEDSEVNYAIVRREKTLLLHTEIYDLPTKKLENVAGIQQYCSG